MRIGLFLGCTVPVRAINYEQAFRRVAQELGIQIIDVPEFFCCGFPLKSVKEESGILMALTNLALAEERGIQDLVTLCNACTENLTEANFLWKEDPGTREKFQPLLKEIGHNYSGSVEVRHSARFLFDEFKEKIKEKITRNLKSLKLFPYTGCHFARPSRIYQGFDNPEFPDTLGELLKSTGAQVLMEANPCCGGAVLGFKEETSLSMAGLTLKEAKKSGSDAMVLICPFCDIMFEQNQKKVEKALGEALDLPVVFLPQVLGLALGIPKEELGFNLNRVKMDSFFSKLEG
ncbi:MAG: CoB--CoM heterodisulfide reductase iron-sulfur subunit B family protein [Caldiserica bacterium]|jgi:heterodisulfide reductase subunit B|nr:CoB--CoM heterodisulfide reductase iron-sulfur subunit B family protein [Caldisericota bacterium]MDH7561795.1 CoB--CoM heterodisulfide reductase iron-sulfur subunit B family protein [Caldisericota bacterium]